MKSPKELNSRYFTAGAMLFAIVASYSSFRAFASCAPPAAGLVSWWRGEANALDESVTNNGTFVGNASFTAGRVGQGFLFDGSGDGVSLGNAVNLRLQTFTIEAWVKRGSTSLVSHDPYHSGIILSYPDGGYGFAFWDDGRLFLTQNGSGAVFSTQMVTDTNYHHVAVTKTGGTVMIYVDGVGESVGPYNPTFVFGGPVAIGARGGDLVASFLGTIDEISVYNRALTGAEIQAIYNAGSDGKCLAVTPPSISSQPADQTVAVGSTATFSVTAAGAVPLSYQWQLNGSNVSGATASSLILPNVQLTNVGAYSVIVTNFAGTVTSSNATLTVVVAPGCVPPAAGLVSWWRGEANALDHAGDNHGALAGNTAFGAGRVGQTCVFDGLGDGVSVGNPANLQLQTFTIEAWIKRGSSSSVSYDTHQSGILFSYGMGGYGFAFWADGRLFLTQNGSSAVFSTQVVTDTNYHHVAVTKNGGTVMIYVDGAGESVGPYAPAFVFAGPAAIGARGGDFAASFLGAIDEISVYNRALAAGEIQAIYNAGSSGKCVAVTAPAITSQPADQTVPVGGSATFHVTAAGSLPLTYQWQLNGTNVSGATASSLVLSSVQVTDAGAYSVIVSNLAGTATSSNATLTVIAAPACVSPAVGLVSWWRAEANALDQVGPNHGALAGNATFGPGRVGQSCVFDGSGDGVSVGNAAGLQLQTFSIEAWIKRGSSAIVSHDPYNSGILFSYGLGGYGFALWTDGRLFLTQNGSGAVYSTQAITDTSYHHVAVTKIGGTVMIYVDGIGESVGPYDPGFVFGGPAAIGARGGDLAASFLGAIDEISIYNRALAVGEIQAIYNAGNSGKCVAPAAPSIFTQPANQTVPEGGNATFTVAANGTAPLSYQWSFGGSPLVDATNASLRLIGVTTNQAGAYAVLVTNQYGAALSSNANLTVVVLGTNLFDDFDPDIDFLQWSSFGGTVRATNYGGFVSAPNALWFGGSGSRFAITRPLNTTSGANIQFYLRIAGGATNSNWERAELPAEGIVLEYSINAGGNWIQIGRYDTSAYFTWTQISVTIPAEAQTPSAQFRWRQLSNSGSANDHWALDDVSIVNGPVAPSVTDQPQSQIVAVGGATAFSVTASGTSPLSYQWQWNGSKVNGATTSSLTLTNVQLTNAGDYLVVVSNAAGTVTSSNASLTVLPFGTCVPPPAGLVSWWRAEADFSDQAGTNTGALAGNTTFGSGRVGQAFVFDGSGDGVAVGNPPGLRLQTFTIEGWIKRGSTAIVSQDPHRSGILFSYPNGGYGFALWDDGRMFLTKNGSSAVYSTQTITDTNYHHVAVTKTGATVMFYRDGAGETVAPYDPGFVFAGPAAVGSRGGDFVASFAGSIDEISVYNRALSASEIQAIAGAAGAGKCVTAVAPFITSSPANQTVQLGGTATFAFAAGGTQPLAYQWTFNGTNIAGATAASLTLTNVSFSQAGNYAVVVTNSAGSATSSTAALTVVFPPAPVRVVGASGPAGGSVLVPVIVVANGNENAVGFSLNFDPTLLAYGSVNLGSGASGAALLLNTNQVVSGKLGVALALPAEGVFPAGTQEVVQVEFTLAVVTNAMSAALGFGDVPIDRQLSDASGSALVASFTGGNVAIAAVEFEGDVSPRPTGDRSLTVTDWVLTGRYAARLDYPTNAAEFQRADSAPRFTLGDGLITVTDWVQAGRYTAKLDPSTPVGGPTAEAPTLVAVPSGPQPKGGVGNLLGRQLVVADAIVLQGEPGNVTVRLEAQGDENALGFSLAFDPAALSYTGVSLGAGAGGATLFVNSNQAAQGRLGFVLSLGTGSHFTPGSKELVNVNLLAAATASGNFPVSLTQVPVPRQVSDAKAIALSAIYINGAITVNPPPSLKIAQADQNLVLSWPLWATHFALQQSAGGPLSTATWTNMSVTVGVSNNENVVTLPMDDVMKFFRLQQR